MAFEVFAFDVVSGDPLGRLEAGQVVWSEQLNAQMTFTCRLDLAHRPNADQAAALLPGRTKLVIFDDQPDVPVSKSFMLWEVALTDRRFLELRCAGLWSWFGQFPLSRSFTFDDVDQHEIAATLLEWSQSPAMGGGIGVALDWSPSGRRRDRTYNGFEYVKVGQRVDELSNVIGGFDFAIDTTFDGQRTVVDTWSPSYPRAGQEWPGSLAQIDVDGSGITMVTEWFAPTTDVREIGAGEGVTMLTATSSDPSLSGYPPLWHVENRKSVERQSTLQGHADRDLQIVNRGVERWSASVLDRYGLLKSLTVGDEAQLAVGPGDFRWPDGLEVVRRVVGRTVTVPDDGGPDRVQLELEESDLGGA